MKAPRFDFTVRQVDDGITVTMDCGGGVYRARNVPAAFLRTLIEACRQAQAEVIEVFAVDAKAVQALPQFPECQMIGSGGLGACDVRITASRDEDRPEYCVAFYDAGDRNAPALLLIDEQINDFIAKAEATLLALPGGHQ